MTTCSSPSLGISLSCLRNAVLDISGSVRVNIKKQAGGADGFIPHTPCRYIKLCNMAYAFTCAVGISGFSHLSNQRKNKRCHIMAF